MNAMQRERWAYFWYGFKRNPIRALYREWHMWRSERQTKNILDRLIPAFSFMRHPDETDAQFRQRIKRFLEPMP
jgi:hypothetical protein